MREDQRRLKRKNREKGQEKDEDPKQRQRKGHPTLARNKSLVTW